MKLPLAFSALVLRLVGRQELQTCAQLTDADFDALPCISLSEICGPNWGGEEISVAPSPSGQGFTFSSDSGNIVYDNGTGILTLTNTDADRRVGHVAGDLTQSQFASFWLGAGESCQTDAIKAWGNTSMTGWVIVDNLPPEVTGPPA